MIALRCLRHTKTDGGGQTLGHLGLMHQRLRILTFLEVHTGSSQSHGCLDLLRHRLGLLTIAGTYDGGIHSLLVFTEIGQYTLNPLRIVIADVAQMTGHRVDKGITRAVNGNTTQLIRQFLDDVLIGDAHVVIGVVTRLRFLLCRCLGNISLGRCRRIFAFTSIDRQSTVEISLTSSLHFLFGQLGIPILAEIQTL